METTYELIRAARGLTQGKSEDLWRVYELSLDDVFFQLQFVMSEEQKITGNLETFYVNVARNAFSMGAPENIATWINEAVHQTLTGWMNANRSDMLEAEERGLYNPSSIQESYVFGREADDIEYTRAVERALCTLPEIHRQTVIAYYYDDMSVDRMVDLFITDSQTIIKRISYIEKYLTQQVYLFCNEHKYLVKKVNSQRIRSALIELSSLYRYPYAEALFNNIRIKAVH